MNDKIASLLLKIKTEGEEKLEGISSMFTTIAASAVAAFAAISAVIYKSIDEYSQQEQAVNSLNRSMVNAGIYSNELRDAYLEQAEALSKVTLFGDEQIIQAQSNFTQMTQGMKLTKEATMAILDFAQAKGMDAASAADLFAKSVSTSTNALARHGIEVNASATAQEKLDSVVRQVSMRMGGQAEAATEGLGSIKQLVKSFGEMFETIGYKLSPAIGILANRFKQFFDDGESIIGIADLINHAFLFTVTLVDRVVTSFNKIAVAVGGVFSSVGTAIQTFKEQDGVAIGLLKSLGALVDGYKDIGKANKQLETEFDVRNTEMYSASLTKRLEVLKNKNLEEQNQTAIHNNNLLGEMERAAKLKNDRELARKEEEKKQRTDEEQLRLENLIAQHESESQLELAYLTQRDSQIYAAKVAQADREIKLAQTQGEKNKALDEKEKAAALLREAKLAEAKEAMLKDSFGKIATMSSSSNSTLATIGKAAALTQIAIDTPVAISKALMSAPPPFNFALAAGVGAAMAAQAAKVAGIPLAEGGIVMPRPGGTQATIGEAGQAEAVIPLDRMKEFGFGGGGGGSNINIIVNGGLMGSETDAREFALAIDKELLKLRRNNESVSFDSGVI